MKQRSIDDCDPCAKGAIDQLAVPGMNVTSSRRR